MTALGWFERAARQAHVGAQYYVAKCLDPRVSSVLADIPRSAEYLARAASQHFRNAITELGLLYLEGKIPAPDTEVAHREAVRLFKLDIQLGGADTDAYVNLGRCYNRGWGVTADRDEAQRLWNHAVTEFDDEWARRELESNGMEVPEYVEPSDSDDY